MANSHGGYRYYRASADGQITIEGSNSILGSWTRIGDLQHLGISNGATGGNVVPQGDAQAIAAAMLGNYGWGSEQMGCLVPLWQKESGWNVYAQNRSSGAYGIPQALPGSKMASAGADWQTNPATQIAWGLGYISGRYGSPCGAWSHSQSVGWY